MFSVLFGATSYVCMDGCMHRLGNSLKKLLHWHWSWTSILLHLLERPPSQCKHLASATATAGLWGRGLWVRLSSSFTGTIEHKAHCFIRSLYRVQVHWVRQNPKSKALSIAVRPLITSTFPYSPLCALPEQVRWPEGWVGDPTCGMQFCHWKKVHWGTLFYGKAFLIVSFLGITRGKLSYINFKLSLSSNFKQKL